MCYTIEINLTRAELEKRFGARLEKYRDIHPRYVVSAFSLPELPVITNKEPNEINLFIWGLIPFWAKDEDAAFGIRMKTFNARAESLEEKPSFRDSFRSRRCLVLVHGFYEWHEHNQKKYPFYIRLKNNQPFALAGLFDNWANRETGEILKTFSVVTTAANPLMEKIHNSKKRMPVILTPDAEKEWINPDLPPAQVREMLKSFNQNELEAYPVSRIIPSRSDTYTSPEILSPFHYPELEGLFK